MKQLLFLLLFPCLALAQYTGNAGQKITLGEQTTADGLVYRGVENDTALITPLSDTSAYIILDTVNNKFYNYNRATNVWNLAGGGVSVSSFSAGTTGLTPSTATTGAVTLGGTLAVANGGTGSATQNFVDLTTAQTVAGNKTFSSGILTISNTNNKFFIQSAGATTGYVGIDLVNSGGEILFTQASSTGAAWGSGITGIPYSANFGSASNTPLVLASNNAGRMIITTNGDVGIGIATPAAKLEVNGGIKISEIQEVITSGMWYNSNLDRLKFTNPGGGFGFNNNANSVELFTIKNDNSVGIGTIAPLALLNVIGTVRINSASAPDANYYLQLENSASQKAKANAWDTYSDKRIKTDIQPIVNAIGKVNLLNPVYYEKHDSYVENDFLNIDYDSSVKSLGFIAQEVYNIIPEAVNTGTTNELWAMDYTKIIPILTKAIQEQQILIKALEQRILILENK